MADGQATMAIGSALLWSDSMDAEPDPPPPPPPPAPLNATSVMSREPSIEKPFSGGNMICTGSAARLRARIVSMS